MIGAMEPLRSTLPATKQQLDTVILESLPSIDNCHSHKIHILLPELLHASSCPSKGEAKRELDRILPCFLPRRAGAMIYISGRRLQVTGG